MLDSMHHMMLKLLCNHQNLIFGVKMLEFCHMYMTLLKGVYHNIPENL